MLPPRSVTAPTVSLLAPMASVPPETVTAPVSARVLVAWPKARVPLLMFVPPEYVLMPESVRVLLLEPPKVKEPLPPITPSKLPGVVWFTVKLREVWVVIVALLVPLEGDAIVPLSDPTVVSIVVERVSTLLLPAPVLVLFTTKGALPLPKVPLPLTVILPWFILVVPA